MYQVNIITGSSITEVNQITLIQTYLTVMQAYLVVKCEKFILKEITVYLIHVLEVKKKILIIFINIQLISKYNIQ